jgi:hypothetical protein
VCFHHTKYRLSFESNSFGVVRLSAFDQNGAKRAPISLDRSDLKSLDRLLSLYRNIRQGGCTTVDTITVTKYRGGAIVAEERFTDDTCDLGSRIEMATFSTYWAKAGGN